jgi:zinc transport system permease protein
MLHAFQPEFMRHALAAGVVATAMCGYLGIYIVLRRIVFVGVALAELSSAGVALALLVGLAPMWGALLLVLCGVAAFSVRWSPQRVPHDTYIGVAYAVAAALGIVLIAKSAQGESHMLEILYGNVLTVSPKETLQMLAAFVGIGVVHWLFASRFTLTAFDPDFSATLGFRTRRWDLLFYLTLGVAISFAIRSVGVLLTFAMLVIPAATALLLTQRLRRAFVASAAVGVIATTIGLDLSLVKDLPAAAAIVGVAFLFLVPALAWHVARRSA